MTPIHDRFAPFLKPDRAVQIYGHRRAAVAYYADEPLEPIGDGLWIPRNLLCWRTPHIGPPVLATLTVTARGLEVTSVLVRPSADREITTGDIRGVKPPDIREDAFRLAAIEERDGRLIPVAGSRADLAARARANLAARDARRPTRGQVVPDDFYAKVAEVYRAALVRGQRNPTDAVRRELFGSHSSAGRWVMEARRRGYLGPATRGRAGEKKGSSDG